MPLKSSRLKNGSYTWMAAYDLPRYRYSHAQQRHLGIHTAEMDFPFINVNHGVAEEWGMANLAAYLEETFPELEVFHIPQKCTYRIAT